ncbi:hypothetical protein NHX12_012721 [Muraenolepis orangiensis]|uniref:Ig-like domain-containing protein n=1 Tax=Muraenolepis orangiensis TaxID=630683 RepID=A0A9Q0DEQ3_9TELE|nr:hypothetical protein NHX12_012721 [Muraenolepis orangiensis]
MDQRTSRCPGGALLLLLLCAVLRGSQPTCPSVCMCTADTLSCSGAGLSRLPRRMPASPLALDLSYNRLTWLGPGGFAGMRRLETLRVARNQLASLGPDAFADASALRRLDLSSNRLRVVESHCFRGLWRLEELVLFDNRIVRVEAAALQGLSGLQKASFSLNLIDDFPFSSVRESSHPFMTTLDLSSNRLEAPPWEEVAALPGWVQRGLFLHNNSLRCDCSMYALFRRWEAEGFDSLTDFREEHVCTPPGDNARSSIRFLKQRRFFQNCSFNTLSLPVLSQPMRVLLSHLVILEGERARLDCRTPLGGGGGGEDPSFAWLTPGRGYVDRAAASDDYNNDDLMSVWANGSLEIPAARLNDSGLYTCVASADLRRAANGTREVNLTVVRAPPADSFSTGYTTLLGCTVTTVLILMYLYLTPCRWGCCKPPGAPAADLYDPDAVYDRNAVYDPGAAVESRHVAFLTPLMEEQSGNGRLVQASEEQVPAPWCWEKTGLYETAFLDSVIKI